MTAADEGPVELGQDGPPLFAVVEVDLVAEFDAGRIPWPPYRRIEAPPCGASIYFPAGITTDGIARSFWCDIQAGQPHDQHRSVYDADLERVFTWPADDRPVGVDGPFKRPAAR